MMPIWEIMYMENRRKKQKNRPIYGICSGDDCGKRAAAETGKTNTENTGLQLLRG